MSKQHVNSEYTRTQWDAIDAMQHVLSVAGFDTAHDASQALLNTKAYHIDTFMELDLSCLALSSLTQRRLQDLQSWLIDVVRYNFPSYTNLSYKYEIWKDLSTSNYMYFIACSKLNHRINDTTTVYDNDDDDDDVDRKDDDSSVATDNGTASIDGNNDAPPQAEFQCSGLARESNMDWTTTDADRW